MVLNEKGYPVIKAGIADAYASPFYRIANPLNKLRYVGDGRYTNHTDMLTAMAEAMAHGTFLTRSSVADWMMQAYLRGMRLDPARRILGVIRGATTTAEFLNVAQSGSEKGGAAVRGWVCGLYNTPQRVMAMTEIQASLTHDTPNGIKSAQAAALMTHFFAYRLGRRRELAEYLNDHVRGHWHKRKQGKAREEGMSIVHAAVQAIMLRDKMSSILQQCVAFGGEVDCVAPIAIGAAAFAHDIQQDLPPHLYNDLEDGEWGRQYLLNVDARLNDWFEAEKLGSSPV